MLKCIFEIVLIGKDEYYKTTYVMQNSVLWKCDTHPPRFALAE